MNLMLDTCVLSVLCHPKHPEKKALAGWIEAALNDDSTTVYVPAIADYELRRELIHLSLRSKEPRELKLLSLDALYGTLPFLELSDEAIKVAADLWAKARHSGVPTAPKEALDGDVILAAQALEVGATVVTHNVTHIARYCAAVDWRVTPALPAVPPPLP